MDNDVVLCAQQHSDMVLRGRHGSQANQEPMIHLPIGEQHTVENLERNAAAGGVGAVRAEARGSSNAGAPCLGPRAARMAPCVVGAVERNQELRLCRYPRDHRA